MLPMFQRPQKWSVYKIEDRNYFFFAPDDAVAVAALTIINREFAPEDPASGLRARLFYKGRIARGMLLGTPEAHDSAAMDHVLQTLSERFETVKAAVASVLIGSLSHRRFLVRQLRGADHADWGVYVEKHKRGLSAGHLQDLIDKLIAKF